MANRSLEPGSEAVADSSTLEAARCSRVATRERPSRVKKDESVRKLDSAYALEFILYFRIENSVTVCVYRNPSSDKYATCILARLVSTALPSSWKCLVNTWKTDEDACVI